MKAEKQKVALVTGASRGIGRAIAVRLSKDGVFVVVHYAHDRKAAAETLRRIEEGGGRGFLVKADFAILKGVRDLFAAMDAQLEKRLGTRDFDILVNNAGLSPRATFEDATEAAFDELVAVNLKAPFFIAQQAMSRLRQGGRIINISSGTSQMAMPEEPVYAMTKAALNSFTRSLAKKLAPRGITVNAIGPGIIDTDFQAGWLSDPAVRKSVASVAALGRLGQPEDIADVAAFLSSPDARWITRAYIDASGGSLLG